MLSDEIRYKLLKAIEENQHASQRELAAFLNVSLGKANYCLKELIAEGFVEAGKLKANQNKSDYAYLLTPQGFEEKARVTLRFLRKKMEEFEQIKSEIARLKMEVADEGKVLQVSEPRL